MLKFTAIAINAPDIEQFNKNIPKENVIAINDSSISGLITNAYNKASTSVNYSREGNTKASHYINNNFIVDIVGRIGNFTIDYCEDPAISDQFQNHYIRAKYNIYDTNAGVLNLSGTIVSHALSKTLGNLPLSFIHTSSGIDVMPKLGYGINYSVQTIGDYGDDGKKLTVLPSYKIGNNPVTNINYLFDSKTLEKIYNVAKGNVSYKLSNSLNSLKAKINPVKSELYQVGDVVKWNDKIPSGIQINQNGGVEVNSNINQVIQGTPSYIILPTNLRTFIGYTARSKQENESIAYKINNRNDNNFIKEFNINYQRWCGQFSLPSSSKFYINNNFNPVNPFNKSVLVNFYITTDKSSAGWALQATNNITQTEKPDTTIPIVEFDLTETSADDLGITGTH